MYSCSVITFTVSEPRPPPPNHPPPLLSHSLIYCFVPLSTLDGVVAVATHSPRGTGGSVGSLLDLGPDGGSRLHPRPQLAPLANGPPGPPRVELFSQLGSGANEPEDEKCLINPAAARFCAQANSSNFTVCVLAGALAAISPFLSHDS